RNMSEVVHYPGCQELSQRDRAEPRVLAREVELHVRQVPGFERAEILGAEPGELVEEGVEGALRIPRAVTESVVRLEAPGGALRENDAGARHPIGFLAVDQVTDVVEGTERLRPLRAASPWRTDVAQQRAKRCGRAFENLGRQHEIEVHVSAAPPAPLRNGTDAACGESPAGAGLPPQPEKPSPSTGRRSRQTLYRR